MIKKDLYGMIALAVVIAATGCMPNHTIKYPLDDVTRVPHSLFADSTLVVKPLADTRSPLATNCAPTGIAVVKRNDKEFYYNCDVHYKKGAPAEIALAMTNHIKNSGLFKDVAFDQDQQITGDYVLTGQLAKFDGLRETHLGATIASQFSLLGLPFMAFMKSDFEATTELNDVKLIRVKDGATIWSGKASGHTQGTEMADPYGWSAYQKADLSLKEATQKVIDAISSANAPGVTTAPTGTQPPITPVAKTTEASH